jgi:cell wall-associated NlpC family hydrolase
MAVLSVQEIYQAALSAGFTPQQATTWTAIALAESGGRTSALNDRGEHSVGLWQINVAADVRRNHFGDLHDPLVNARAAYEISRHGTDMRPWTTTHASNKGTNADYRHYLPRVEQVTGVQGDGRGVEGYGSKLPPPLPSDGTAAPTQAQFAYDQITAGRPVGTQMDTDHDGLTDAFEQATGSRFDVADTDHDGLSDGYEVVRTHSSPVLADTDLDGLSDTTEASLGTSANQWDSDHDGLSDAVEVKYGSNPLYAEAGDGTAPPGTMPGGMPPAGPGTPPVGPGSMTPGGMTPGPGGPGGMPGAGGMAGAGMGLAGPGMAPGGTGVPGYGAGGMPGYGAAGSQGPPTFEQMQQAAMRQPAPQTAGSADHTKLDRFVDVALKQSGDDYVFGASVKLSDPDPERFDCSELTRWAAHQAGVKIPDGAMYQYLDLKQRGALMPVEQALHTKGALLFYFSREPVPGGGRPSTAHVAISLGDGRTIEARGSRYGVGEFSAKNRFNYAGMIPGLDASGPPPPQAMQSFAPEAQAPIYDQIDSGAPVQAPADADHDGLTDAFEKLARMNPNAADTDHDGLSDAFEAIRSHTDPLSADTDHDGVSDASELAAGTDAGRIPGVAGVSGQGQFAELIRYGVKDSDHDGLSDTYEQRAGLNANAADTDSDGLSDGVERSLGTNAALFDSDNDGIGDSLEVQFGSGAVPGQPGTMGAALGPDPNDPLNPGTPGLGLDDLTPEAPH